MSKIISQLEFWLILFGLAAAPNWSWPVWGSVEESRMIVIGLVVAGLAILELLNVIAKPMFHRLKQSRNQNFGIASSPALREGRGPRNDKISFGFFQNPLNWIISMPLFLVIAGAAKDGVLFVPYQFFGFAVPWHTAVLPVFLLLAWHFLLRSFFSSARDDRTPLLKFAFAWLIIFAITGLIRRTWIPASAGMTTYFILAGILALVLSALRVPLSAPARSYRLGRLIYLPLLVLIAAAGLFIRFEIRVARAAAAASQNDFTAARKLNPYQPLYGISWVEREIRNLENMDLTADVAAAKEKVGEIVKELEGLMSLRGAERRSNPGLNRDGLGIASSRFAGLAMTIRVARAWENLGKFAEGANERALAIYDALIAAQGAEPDSSLIVKKALLLEKSGKVDEAIEFLSPLTPQGGRGDNQQGDTLSLSGRGEGEGWKDAEIRYHLGRLLYNSGKEKEASEIWLSLLKDDPDYADVNYSLGAYFARQGEAAEALNYFQKVLQLVPDNAEVKKKIDELKSKR